MYRSAGDYGFIVSPFVGNVLVGEAPGDCVCAKRDVVESARTDLLKVACRLQEVFIIDPLL